MAPGSHERMHEGGHPMTFEGRVRSAAPPRLKALIARLGNENAKRGCYLTDLIGKAVGDSVNVHEMSAPEKVAITLSIGYTYCYGQSVR